MINLESLDAALSTLAILILLAGDPRRSRAGEVDPIEELPPARLRRPFPEGVSFHSRAPAAGLSWSDQGRGFRNRPRSGLPARGPVGELATAIGYLSTLEVLISEGQACPGSRLEREPRERRVSRR